MKKDIIPCTLRELPEELWLAAAQIAVEMCPDNEPCLAEMHGLETLPDPLHLAVMTKRYWGTKGVKLGVTFLDTRDTSLKARILSHMNAWGQRANVVFMESGQGEVRVARQRGSGYWSYLGTDILSVPAGQPTMNLDSFTNSTSEREYVRVVRHETGHTLGFPHEHMRPAIIARLDVRKTLDYFQRSQGWSESVTRANVLTPLRESDLIAGAADETSIMAYQLPASITTDGRPIVGGADINEADHALVARIYPQERGPVPEGGGHRFELFVSDGGRRVEVRPL